MDGMNGTKVRAEVEEGNLYTMNCMHACMYIHVRLNITFVICLYCRVIRERRGRKERREPKEAWEYLECG